MPRSKKPIIKQEPVQTETQDFVVLNTSVIDTTPKEPEQKSIDAIAKDAIESAVRSYDFNNKQTSVILDPKGSALSPTLDVLDNLADRAQNDLSKILQINAIVAKRINMDDIIGKIVESIYVNINDEFRLS